MLAIGTIGTTTFFTPPIALTSIYHNSRESPGIRTSTPSAADRCVAGRAEGTGSEGDMDSKQLLKVLYDELRHLARQHMASERPGSSLQATALVHEAFLRIVGDQPNGWVSRAQFFGAAAEAMRRILIERARARATDRRGGNRKRVSLSVVDLAVPDRLDDILAINEALLRLELANPRAAQVVRLRFFAGLDEEETAAALELSTRTVRREWTYARAWLYDAIQGED